MKEYILTQDQFDVLLTASKPVPLMMLQLGVPSSPQEVVNDEWERLGVSMGFNHLTVTPNGKKGDRHFFAEPVTVNKGEE